MSDLHDGSVSFLEEKCRILTVALSELLDNGGYLTMEMSDIDYMITEGHSEHYKMIKRARLALLA